MEERTESMWRLVVRTHPFIPQERRDGAEVHKPQRMGNPQDQGLSGVTQGD